MSSSLYWKGKEKKGKTIKQPPKINLSVALWNYILWNHWNALNTLSVVRYTLDESTIPNDVGALGYSPEHFVKVCVWVVLIWTLVYVKIGIQIPVFFYPTIMFYDISPFPFHSCSTFNYYMEKHWVYITMNCRLNDIECILSSSWNKSIYWEES